MSFTRLTGCAICPAMSAMNAGWLADFAACTDPCSLMEACLDQEADHDGDVPRPATRGSDTSSEGHQRPSGDLSHLLEGALAGKQLRSVSRQLLTLAHAVMHFALSMIQSSSTGCAQG